MTTEMKRDNSTKKNKFSKAGLVFGIGFTVFSAFSQGYLIYKERQGDLTASFPEAENEIKQAVNAVRQQQGAETDE